MSTLPEDPVPPPVDGVAKTTPYSWQPASARFHAGELVAGRYRIVALLGEGGMGEVYRAEDQTLDQTVALKFLPESRADDPNWIARLREEVARARQVSHPNVCRVHDIGEEAGRPFLTMEFIDGEDLAISLQRVGRLPPERVVGCAAQLCDALAALHERGLLHRDLKPSNILLDRQRKVRLLDFGIAALADRIHEEDHRAGTLAYMAPEQLAGGDASVHSDLFALGLVLYELTTGSRPFPGRTADELIRQHGGPAPTPPSDRVPGIDPALNRVILGCLAINPARRPASALEVKQGLPPLSPRETQEVEGTGQLRPIVAAGLLGATLLLLALHAWLAPRVMLWHQVPLENSPEVLAGDARAILKRMGYESRGDYSASGLAWDLDHIQDIRNRPAPDRWGDLARSRSPVLYFWFRTSPSPLHPSYLPSPADPPPLLPGMVCVILDTSGRLVELRALGRARPGVKGEVKDEDWEKVLFEAAGLDRMAFSNDELPDSPPPVYADERRAWRGKEGDEAVRVEAAAYLGRAVYFLVRADEGGRAVPRDRIASSWHTRLIDSLTGPGQAILGMVVLGGLIMARRNMALGRADGQGAVRVGFLYLACVLGGWLINTSFLWTMPTARSMFVVFLGTVTYWLVILMVTYLALEPYFRRRWPHRLSAWNRLMAGRYRDPLVGRDILLGVMAGLVINGLAKVMPLVDTSRGDTSWYLEWVAGMQIHGPDVGPGRMLSVFSSALVLTFLWAVLFLLMVLVFRREWLAVGAVIALNLYGAVISFLGMQATSAVLWVGTSLCLLAIYLVLIRVGVLGLLLTCFVGMILASMPLTLEPARWLVTTNLLTILLIAGLAGYGALVSLGGQPFLRDEV
jgi:serine/threonine protein kinase